MGHDGRAGAKDGKRGDSNADCSKACVRLVVEGTALVGRPKKTCGVKWRPIGQHTANSASSGKPH